MHFVSPIQSHNKTCCGGLLIGSVASKHSTITLRQGCFKCSAIYDTNALQGDAYLCRFERLGPGAPWVPLWHPTVHWRWGLQIAASSTCVLESADTDQRTTSFTNVYLGNLLNSAHWWHDHHRQIVLITSTQITTLPHNVPRCSKTR